MVRNYLVGPIRGIIAVACAVAVVLLAAGGCQNAADAGKKESRPQQNEPRTVRVAEVELRAWPQTIRVQGTLLPHEQSVVGTRIAGVVERVQVDLGSKVAQGELLVSLDQVELALSVQQAEAQLTQACAAIGLRPDQSEKELNREEAPPVKLERAVLDEAAAGVERGRQLVARKAMSTEEFQRLEALQKAAEARYQSAINNVGEQIAVVGVRRAALALARQQLADAQIVAPYEGVVEERHVSPGEHVQSGDAIVTLVRADTLRFKAGIPERGAEQVRPGQPLQIHIEGETRPLEAKISRVSPGLTQSSRSLWIEADVPNPEPRRRTGLFAEADITVNPQSEALTVPAGAVTEFAGVEKVWIVRDGQAAERPVRTGRRNAEYVEILDGLTRGDLVIARSEDGQAGAVTAVRDEEGGGRRTAISHGRDAEDPHASE